MVLVLRLIGILKTLQGMSNIFFVSLCITSIIDVMLISGEFIDHENSPKNLKKTVVWVLGILSASVVIYGALMSASNMEWFGGILKVALDFVCELFDHTPNIQAALIIAPAFIVIYFFVRRLFSKHLISLFNIKKREWN